jgi:protein-S-isoprenylcysteine O-methyltransferase Ste14
VDFEEKLLVQKYGQDYEQYQNTVKKFIPYLY